MTQHNRSRSPPPASPLSRRPRVPTSSARRAAVARGAVSGRFKLVCGKISAHCAEIWSESGFITFFLGQKFKISLNFFRNSNVKIICSTKYSTYFNKQCLRERSRSWIRMILLTQDSDPDPVPLSYRA
jgi:hypothetical protein